MPFLGLLGAGAAGAGAGAAGAGAAGAAGAGTAGGAAAGGGLTSLFGGGLASGAGSMLGGMLVQKLLSGRSPQPTPEVPTSLAPPSQPPTLDILSGLSPRRGVSDAVLEEAIRRLLMQG